MLERFGSRVVYDSALSLTSKVSAIIDVEEWRWPLTNTWELMEIREQMVNLPLPFTNNDFIVWVPSPNRKFSTAWTWEYLRDPSPTIPWSNLLSFPGHIPPAQCHSLVSYP